MGWYIRKPFTLGRLLRVNLSKSGLGFSLGIKGARIGTGPRGNYVHLGRYGLYYRQSLPPFGSEHKASSTGPSLPTVVPGPEQGVPITTADVSVLKDQSAQQLLTEIQEKHRMPRVAPIVSVFFGLVIMLLILLQLSLWLCGVLTIVALIVYLRLARFDRERKTVTLHFNLDDSARANYQAFSTALQYFASSSAIWKLSSQQSVIDPKYYAGAVTLVDKNQASMGLGAPPFVQTEIAVWHLTLRGQILYFFPDRILVYQGSKVGAVPYCDLHLSLQEVRFVENSHVPADTTVVDRTWRYTNRNGGPDRRFAINPQIPVVRYGEIHITSSAGLNIFVQTSNTERARVLVSGIAEYCREMSLPKAGSATGDPQPSQIELRDGRVVPRPEEAAEEPKQKTKDACEDEGKEGAMFCTSCGHKNPSDARFCSQCGKPVTAADASDSSTIPVSGDEAGHGSEGKQAQTTSEGKSTHDTDRTTSVILVEVRNKRYHEEQYENYIWWDATYDPVGLTKKTRAMKGTVEFADLFGEVKFKVQVVINDPMDPGRKLTTPGIGFKYNQFMDAHKWMLCTDLSDMHVKFRVQSIIYADGTTEELE